MTIGARHADWTERTFAPTPESVPAARRFADGYANHLDPRDREAVSLVVSELASNAVRHAQSEFVVAVGPVGEGFRIEVRDSSSQPPVLRHPKPTDVTGRGLTIVAALAQQWGTDFHAGGKTVWAEVARA